MSEKSDETPKPRRRLGLSLRRAANTTPGQRTQLGNSQSSKSDETPTSLKQPLKSSSTNCRRPGLSRIKKDLTKKKLEFTALNETEGSTESPKPPKQKKRWIDPEEKWRLREIADLEAKIEIWKVGFAKVIDDIQALVRPRVCKRELLKQLRVPSDMMKYLEDDS